MLVVRTPSGHRACGTSRRMGPLLGGRASPEGGSGVLAEGGRGLILLEKVGGCNGACGLTSVGRI